MRRWMVISTLAILLFSVGATVMAETFAPLPTDEQPVEIAIPPSDFGIPDSRVYRQTTPIFDLYKVNAYSLDGVYPALELGARTWNGIASAMIMLTAAVVKLAIRTLEWAFTMVLVHEMIADVDLALRNLGTDLWDARLVQVGIALTGMWAAWTGLVLRRTSQAISLMASVVLLVCVATWSFSGGLSWAMRFISSASTEFSGVVLTGVSKATSKQVDKGNWTSTEAFTSAGEAIWTVLVAYPWALAEFGDLRVAEGYRHDRLPGDKILTLDTVGRAQIYKELPKEVRDRDFAWWTTGAVVQRLVVTSLALVVGLTFALMLIALGIAVLAFQLLALIVMACAPLVFLVALIFPHAGMHILSRWASKIVGALAMKIVLAAMLSLVLMFSTILHRVGAPYGWATSALLQLVLVAVVVLKWRAMFGFLTSLPTAPERAMSRLAETHEPAIIRAGRFAANSSAQGWVTSKILARGDRGDQDHRRASTVQRSRYRPAPAPPDTNPPSPSGSQQGNSAQREPQQHRHIRLNPSPVAGAAADRSVRTRPRLKLVK